MRLTPVERDRLEVFVAAELARKRRARGLRLSHPEAVAFICDELLEAARDGRSVSEVTDLGYQLLSPEDVMEGVADLIDVLRVEPLFDEGTVMVSLFNPISGNGPVDAQQWTEDDSAIVINADLETIELEVTNVVDRAVQVTSHYHFFEVTHGLSFDRWRAFGYRVDVAAGSSVRFEAGESKTVRLIPIGGRRNVYGQAGLTEGNLDDPTIRQAAFAAAARKGYINEEDA